MSQTAESKWTEFKEGTEKLFKVSSEYISVVLDPVMAKGKEVVGNISEKIDSSDNEKVKYLKEIGSTTVEAVRHAFNGAVSAASEVGTSVTKTTKDIWEKKYGDDASQPVNPETVGNAPASYQHRLSDDVNENIEVDKEPLIDKIEASLKEPTNTEAKTVAYPDV